MGDQMDNQVQYARDVRHGSCSIVFSVVLALRSLSLTPFSATAAVAPPPSLQRQSFQSSVQIHQRLFRLSDASLPRSRQ